MAQRRAISLKNSKKYLFVGAISMTAILTSCSLDGGTGSANKEKSMASTEREYIAVTANAGAEPTVGQPVGSAPTTWFPRT